MRKIKLSGRERAVIKAIDFANGSTGEAIQEHTRIEAEDVVDILNALLGAGYAEVVPYVESTTVETFRTALFEVNPSYALDLREALIGA
jgi:hypothetical protein